MTTPEGNLLKSGGLIAWEVQGEGSSAELVMRQTMGANIKKGGADELNIPGNAVIKTMKITPDDADNKLMSYELFEFRRAEQIISLKAWDTYTLEQPEVDLERDLREQTWDFFKDHESIFVFSDYEMNLSDRSVSQVDKDADYFYQMLEDCSYAHWNDMVEACFGMTYNAEENQEFMDKMKNGELQWTGKFYLQYAHGDGEDRQIAVTDVTYGIAGEGQSEGDDSWRKDRRKTGTE